MTTRSLTSPSASSVAYFVTSTIQFGPTNPDADSYDSRTLILSMSKRISRARVVTR